MNIKFSNNTMSRKEIGAYVLLQFPFYFITMLYGTTYYEFFHDYLALSDTLITVASIIYILVNPFTDALLGIWSDKVDPRKWGSRRLIFLRWGGAIWGILFILIWIPWSRTNQTLIFFHFLLTTSLMDNGYSVVFMSLTALLPELESNVDKRIKIGWVGGVMILLASGTAMGLIAVKDRGWDRFFYMNIVIGILMTILLFVLSKLLHERPEFVDTPDHGFRSTVKTVFKYKSFIIFMFYNLLANKIPGAITTYVYLYRLVIPLDYLVLYAILIIPNVIGPVIGLKLKKHWGIKGVMLFGLFGSAIGGLAFFGLSFINSNYLFPLLGVMLMGFLKSPVQSIHSTVQSLSMDEDEVMTGKRHEASFLGIDALVTKPGSSLATIIVTWTLTLSGYQIDTVSQPLSAMNGVKILILVIPSLCSLIGGLFFLGYPLSKNKIREIYEKLEDIHASKKSTFNDKILGE